MKKYKNIVTVLLVMMLHITIASANKASRDTVNAECPQLCPQSSCCQASQCDCCLDTLKIIEAIKEYCGCDSNCTPITEDITITEGGCYELIDNTQACVTIDADDVLIRLNGFTLFGSIIIASGHNNIEIINGKIKNNDCANHGILVEDNTHNIQILDIVLFDFLSGAGIYLNGAAEGEIKSCCIEHSKIRNCSKGLVANYTKKSTIQNCQASNCSQAGFEFNNSKFNEINACSALEISNDDGIEVVGFASKSGQGNLFYQCVTEGIYLSTGTFCTNAIGFLLGGTEAVMEEESKVIECIIDSTKTATIGISPAYGIFLEPQILSSGLSLIEDNDFGAEVKSVAWSHDRQYLAAGGDRKLAIFQPNGSLLIPIATEILDQDIILRVAWSPDGKYLAICAEKIYIYQFNGSSLVEIVEYAIPLSEGALDIAWSPDSKYITAGTLDGEVYILQFDGSSLVERADYSLAVSVNAVSWSPDGQYIAAASDNKVYVLEFLVSALIEVGEYTFGDIALSVAWSPDGKYLAAGSNDDHVYVLQFTGSSLVEIANYEILADRTLDVAWSPGGKYIAAGSEDNNLYVLQFDGSSLVEITDYTLGDVVLGVAWSPDGAYLAAGSNDPDEKVYIFSIMNAPSKNVIDGNRICNTSGAFNGIGIVGGGDNLFIRNIGYHNDVNFSYGVMRTAGLTGKIGFLDNIWVPPYQFYVHGI